MAPYSPLRRKDERARHIAHRQVTAGSGTNPNGGAFSLTGPITITVFVPPSTTIPQPTTTPITTPIVGQISSSSPVILPPTTTSSNLIVATPSSSSGPATTSTSSRAGGANNSTPVASVVPSASGTGTGTPGGQGQANGALSNSSSGLSTGAIVGVVIAILVILIALVVFFLRRKSIFARQKRRATWLSKGGIMGPKPIPGYDTVNFEQVMIEKPAPSPPVPAGFGISSRDTYVPGGATEAAAYTYSTNTYTSPQPDLAPPPTSYLNDASPTSGSTPVIMRNGQPATVLCSFVPSLPDELDINTGDVVRIVAEYDDGWAMCVNANNDQGMVPLECLDRSGSVPMPGGIPQKDPRAFKRVSSLTTSSGRSGTTMLAPNRFN